MCMQGHVPTPLVLFADWLLLIMPLCPADSIRQRLPMLLRLVYEEDGDKIVKEYDLKMAVLVSRLRDVTMALQIDGKQKWSFVYPYEECSRHAQYIGAKLALQGMISFHIPCVLFRKHPGKE